MSNIMDICNTDEFEFFLIWLVREKGYEDAIFIIDVSCNPHKYDKYYQEYKEVDNGIIK